jgi:site-specific DNA recombinase
MRYFIYCRKSSDREDRQVLSIDAQKRKVLEYAERNELEIARVFVETKSAYKTGRPLFNEMMELLEEGKADAILTYHITRLARNARDGGDIIYFMDSGVIKEIRTPENTLKDNSNDKFMMQIHFAMSKKSSDDNKDFVTRDIESKLLKGEYPGFAPLGYLNIDENGKIAGKQYEPEKQRLLEEEGRVLKRVEIDPLIGPQIRRLFEKASTGVYSMRRLADLAHDLGIRPRRGKKLSKATTYSILTNDFFRGVIRFRGELFTENVQHEALVPKKLFTRVQTMIDRRGTGSQRSHLFAYTGLMKCDECDCGITAQIQRGHVYYNCTRNKGPCSQKKYIREEIIEEQLKKVLTGLVIPPSFLSFAFDKTKKLHKQEVKTVDTQRKSIERSYDEGKRRLDNLLQMKLSPKNVDGALLSEDEYIEQKKNIKDEMEKLEAQLQDKKGTGTNWVDDCEGFISTTQDFCRCFENGTLEEKKELFLLLCSNMTLKDGELAFSYAEPFESIAKFSLAGEGAFERRKALPEKKLAALAMEWRDRRDSNPRPLP